MDKAVILTVYVAGQTPAAKRAIANLRRLCAEHMEDDAYSIEVCDIRESPQRAEDEKILATPTVIRTLPPPVRRLVGDLSDEEQVMISLDLVEK